MALALLYLWDRRFDFTSIRLPWLKMKRYLAILLLFTFSSVWGHDIVNQLNERALREAAPAIEESDWSMNDEVRFAGESLCAKQFDACQASCQYAGQRASCLGGCMNQYTACLAPIPEANVQFDQNHPYNPH